MKLLQIDNSSLNLLRKEGQVMEKLRSCVVNDKKALFHRWAEKSKVINSSALVGGHLGGVIQQTVGIIEYLEDGAVCECYPNEIRFVNRSSISKRNLIQRTYYLMRFEFISCVIDEDQFVTLLNNNMTDDEFEKWIDTQPNERRRFETWLLSREIKELYESEGK